VIQSVYAGFGTRCVRVDKVAMYINRLVKFDTYRNLQRPTLLVSSVLLSKRSALVSTEVRMKRHRVYRPNRSLSAVVL